VTREYGGNGRLSDPTLFSGKAGPVYAIAAARRNLRESFAEFANLAEPFV
jgi:hypothetical protein